MRGSILYPNQTKSTVVGIVTAGVVFFLLGLILIKVGNYGKTSESVHLQIPLVHPPFVKPFNGDVFLLDESRGKIVRIGRFVIAKEDSLAELRLPKAYANSLIDGATLWDSYYENPFPFVSFIGDDELQQRGKELATKAWKDKEVSDQLSKLISTIATKALSDTKGRVSFNEILGLLLSPKEALRFPSEFFEELIKHPEIRAEFKELLQILEPYLLQGVQEILWAQTSLVKDPNQKVPNVKLIWAARRLIFGAREPALTIFAAPDDFPGDSPTSLTITEIF